MTYRILRNDFVSLGTCPEGWTKTDPGTCIKYFGTKKNYSSAKSSCANRMGGAVVTLETEEKIAFFNTFLAQQGNGCSAVIIMKSHSKIKSLYY